MVQFKEQSSFSGIEVSLLQQRVAAARKAAAGRERQQAKEFAERSRAGNTTMKVFGKIPVTKEARRVASVRREAAKRERLLARKFALKVMATKVRAPNIGNTHAEAAIAVVTHSLKEE